MAEATTSLPVPVSPSMSTVELRGATRRMRCVSSRIGALSPMRPGMGSTRGCEELAATETSTDFVMAAGVCDAGVAGVSMSTAAGTVCVGGPHGPDPVRGTKAGAAFHAAVSVFVSWASRSACSNS